MKPLRFFSPRTWVGAILGMAILLLPVLSGCSGSTRKDKDTSANTNKEQPKLAAGETVAIGFIYVGPKDDYGYNQAHAEGAAAVKKMPNVKVFEEEKVP